MLTENQSKNVIWVTVSDRKDLSPMLKAYRAFQALNSIMRLYGAFTVSVSCSGAQLL